MHPDILWQLVAEHTRDLMTEAGEARRAREARPAQRRRLAAHLRRLTRLAAQQPGSRRESRIPVTPGRGRPGRGVPVVLTNDPTTQHIRERNSPTQRRCSRRCMSSPASPGASAAPAVTKRTVR